MGLDQDEVYSEVQGVFRRGLVVVVGSGASSAHGLPGMGKLADHLISNVPAQIRSQGLACTPEWAAIEQSLHSGKGLEEALHSVAVSNEMTDVIAEQVADCIAEREISAINELLSGAPVPAFSRLFQHMLHSAERVDVITTNYDRLLEVQAARVGIGVDSMFYGHTVGKFDPVRSRQAMLRAENQTGRGRFASMKVIPHVRLSKPHGSLDWFTFNNEHFRSDLTIPGSRRIVAPGGNKYRLGYEVPFDQQREQANRAIDSASALLFVGYGFNDDHLQTHIANRIQQVPSVVLSRTITPNARRYLSTSPSAYGIEGHILDTQHTRVTRGEYEISIDRPIWDLNCLLEEVLGK